MSGKPYREGVAALRAALVDRHQAQDERAELLGKINLLKMQVEAAESRYADATAKIQKLMQEMDLHASGNYGWDNRFIWALCELVDQAEKHARAAP